MSSKWGEKYATMISLITTMAELVIQLLTWDMHKNVTDLILWHIHELTSNMFNIRSEHQIILCSLYRTLCSSVWFLRFCQDYIYLYHPSAVIIFLGQFGTGPIVYFLFFCINYNMLGWSTKCQICQERLPNNDIYALWISYQILPFPFDHVVNDIDNYLISSCDKLHSNVQM